MTETTLPSTADLSFQGLGMVSIVVDLGQVGTSGGSSGGSSGGGGY